ncbi:MAG: serpin family protein [Eubacteriales bacterium]|nr:serpin family protein [Eubacteriales bacterium]
MKSIDEFKNSVYEKAADRKRTNRLRRKTITAAVCCLCVALAVSFISGIIPLKSGNIAGTDNSSDYSTDNKSKDESVDVESSNNGENNSTDETSKTNPLPMAGITDLMAGIVNTNTEECSLDDELLASTADFYLNFVKAVAKKGENLIFSPASAHFALAMTTNGAANDTLTAMENVLAGGKSITSLNRFMAAYADEISGDHLKIANSLWIGEGRVSVYEDFLKANAAYYNAGAFYADFDNDETINSINAWIEQHTDGMIKDMLEEIEDAHIMFLINAITFEAEWNEDSISGVLEDRTFNNYDGTTSTVTEFMYTGNSKSLTVGDGNGVLMPYKDCNFSFAAILPGEGTDVYDFLASINGDAFINAVKSAENNHSTDIFLPEFETASSLKLKDPLSDLGMGIAFADSGAADFTKLGTARGQISIGSVNQDAAISVTRVGTKASAATIVAMVDECVHDTVYFNRPFVYAIIDNTTGLPVFIGICADMG